MYIFTSVIWFFPFLGAIIDPVFKLMFLWGSLLLVYDFFVKKSMFKGKYFVFMFLFLLSYVVTIVVNIHGQLYMGIKHLIYSAIAILLIFNLMHGRKEQEIKKMIYRFNNILIVIAGIASAISLLMYFFSVSIEMEYMGNHIRQGFIDHRLFGIYTSANTGATMAIFSVAFMFINSYIKSESFGKWYKINFLVQLVYFSLTLSRGGSVTVYALVILYLLFVLLPKYLKKETKKKSVLKIFCIFIVFCLASIVVPKGIQYGSQGLNRLVGQLVSTIQGEQSDKKEDSDELDNEIKRIESGDDMSNNRFTIWSAGIQLWRKSPIFGVADVRVDAENMVCGIYDISDLSEDEKNWLEKVEGNLHNSYVEILVNSGVVGSIAFLLVAILIGINYLKYLFDKNKKNETTYYLCGMIFAFVVSILVNCCFENRILFDRQNPFGLIFWLYLGIGCSLIDNGSKGGMIEK